MVKVVKLQVEGKGVGQPPSGAACATKGFYVKVGFHFSSVYSISIFKHLK